MKHSRKINLFTDSNYPTWSLWNVPRILFSGFVLRVSKVTMVTQLLHGKEPGSHLIIVWCLYKYFSLLVMQECFFSLYDHIFAIGKSKNTNCREAITCCSQSLPCVVFDIHYCILYIYIFCQNFNNTQCIISPLLWIYLT